MLKAVIFDMDGVIVDTEPGFFTVTNQVLAQYGAQIDKKTNGKFLGQSNLDFWQTLIDTFQLPRTVEQCVKEMESFREILLEEEGFRLIEGAKELIYDLYQEGIPLAVASSSPMSDILRVTETFDIRKCFKELITGMDCEQSKPAPEIFLNAANKLQVEPKNCLVIEDSINGVKAAKAAGMKVIGFHNTAIEAPHLEQADMEVNSMKEISVKLCKTISAS